MEMNSKYVIATYLLMAVPCQNAEKTYMNKLLLSDLLAFEAEYFLNVWIFVYRCLVSSFEFARLATYQK